MTQQYRPVGNLAVEVAVATAITSGVASTVRIYIRSKTAVVSPTTFITTHALEHEVVSHAGLSEDTEFSTYTLIRTDTYDDSFVYVVDATVS